MTKFCPRCEQDKDRDQFTPNRARTDGLSGYCRDCMTSYHVEREARLRTAVLALYGDECARCGITDKRVLTIDHVHGGGRQDRLGGMKQAKFYRHVLADPDGYRLLCFNCNWIAHVEGDSFVAPESAVLTAG